MINRPPEDELLKMGHCWLTSSLVAAAEQSLNSERSRVAAIILSELYQPTTLEPSANLLAPVCWGHQFIGASLLAPGIF